jgi:hypothetical protein
MGPWCCFIDRRRFVADDGNSNSKTSIERNQTPGIVIKHRRNLTYYEQRHFRKYVYLKPCKYIP